MANDAFISYSHSADQRLAEALERHLQAFAKPWYKRRALQVFRDHGNLNLSPHLWASIQKALDESRFFIFLASPGSAQSEWCGKEVEHWKAYRDRSKVILAVTDGDVVWDRDNRDFDGPQSSAIPNAMQGLFDDEPFFLDLRTVKNDADLSMRNPRFKQSVVQIAAALHDKPVEDMVGQEIEQQRRVNRLRNGVIIALTALLVVAIALAVYAFEQRNVARAQTEVARAKTKDAALQLLALEAETVWRHTKYGRNGMATAKYLYDRLPDDPRVQRIVYTVLDSRWAGGPLTHRIYAPEAPVDLGERPNIGMGAWGPSGDVIAFVEESSTIGVIRLTDDRPQPVLRSSPRPVTSLAYLTSGHLVAAHETGGFSVWGPDLSLDQPLSRAASGKVRTTVGSAKFLTFTEKAVTVRTANGEVANEVSIRGEGTIFDVAADSNAERLVVWIAHGGSAHRLDLYSATDGFVRTLQASVTPLPVGSVLTFSADGASVLALAEDGPRLVDLRASAKTLSFDGPSDLIFDLKFAPGGRVLAPLTMGDGIGIALLFTPDASEPVQLRDINYHVSVDTSERLIATVSGGGQVKLWSESGEELFRFKTGSDRVKAATFSPEGKRLLLTGSSGVYITNVDASEISQRRIKGDADPRPAAIVSEIAPR